MSEGWGTDPEVAKARISRSKVIARWVAENKKPCKDCGQWVVWAKTPFGKLILMDVEHVRKKRVWRPFYDGVLKVERVMTGGSWSCHFDTCPARRADPEPPAPAPEAVAGPDLDAISDLARREDWERLDVDDTTVRFHRLKRMVTVTREKGDLIFETLDSQGKALMNRPAVEDYLKMDLGWWVGDEWWTESAEIEARKRKGT